MQIPNLNTPEILNALAALYAARVKRRIAMLAAKADRTFTETVNATIEEINNGKERQRQLKAERKQALIDAKKHESKAVTHLLALLESEAARQSFVSAYGEAQADKMARETYAESIKRF